MLVLTRLKDEEIIIKDPKTGLEITILMVNVLGNKAKIGVHAPKNMIVDRKEIYDKRSHLSLVG